jgi:hypothetical protein
MLRASAEGHNPKTSKPGFWPGYQFHVAPGIIVVPAPYNLHFGPQAPRLRIANKLRNDITMISLCERYLLSIAGSCSHRSVVQHYGIYPG